MYKNEKNSKGLIIKTSLDAPSKIENPIYRFDNFNNDECMEFKKLDILPAMGWNSWNAFGCNNTEALTRAMADKIKELELDKLGYSYLVLDDGCYRNERVNGHLSPEPDQFPSGFRAMADYLHSKGLKFGMYNDIGPKLCSGNPVGTCGYEDVDSESYNEWDIDYIKVDNCYYLWDNATFSDEKNAKYSYAPNIKSISLTGHDSSREYTASGDGYLTGRGASFHEDGYATGIGSFDGTNVGNTPVGDQSGELRFDIKDLPAGEYDLVVEYSAGEEIGTGSWLEVGIYSDIVFDDILPSTKSTTDFVKSKAIPVTLTGNDTIRLMNHRRQENTLVAYSVMLHNLREVCAKKDIVLSICEWGKTQPQNWGYKVGSSWRILNDITFRVGNDGDPGEASWEKPGTDAIASQYDKRVIMDEFAGIKRGWNDPDMLVIGMGGVDDIMARTHMTMWCMMNSPLMLGMDLRKVKKNDNIYNIIANKDVIDLNQDALGIQAKRIFASNCPNDPDTTYITDNDRWDVVVKPLSDGSVAVSFFNMSDHEFNDISIDITLIEKYLSHKMADPKTFFSAKEYRCKNLWTKEKGTVKDKKLTVKTLSSHDNYTVRLYAE